MNPRLDYYQILGVEQNANEDAIRSAHRRLVMQHHPDRNPNDSQAEAKFKEVQEAYDILSDGTKRKRYDSMRRGQPASDGFFNVWDIFNTRSTPANIGGADVLQELFLSLEEVVRGCKTNIDIPWNETCTICSGNGLKSGCSKTQCNICNGKGRVSSQRRIQGGGVVTTVAHCTHCNGVGSTASPADQCPTCNGKGLIDSRKKISVTVPKGLIDGMSLRLIDQGLLRLPAGQRGKLYVTIRIKPHDIFEVDNANIYLQYPITLFEAAYGVKAIVPTLYGPYEIELKPGTQSGKKVVIEKKGLQMGGSAKGTMVVEFYCEIPALTDTSEMDVLTRASFETETKFPKTFRAKKKFAEYLSKLQGDQI